MEKEKINILYRFIDLYWIFSDRKRDVYVTTQKINSILLKATLLGVNGSSGWLPVPANFKKVWKNKKFKKMQHLIKFLASYI